VELRFQPLWLYVDAVREFCGFFARATFGREELGDRIGLVVHELVENAVRYGDDNELELKVERTGDQVSVSVANTVTDDHIRRLKDRFDEIVSLPPRDAYIAAMQRAATLPEGQSGLGLPRIRFEGQVELKLVATPGRVCVTATGSSRSTT
jgi:hypothetical protein